MNIIDKEVMKMLILDKKAINIHLEFFDDETRDVTLNNPEDMRTYFELFLRQYRLIRKIEFKVVEINK